MIALERLLQREGFGSRKECRRLVGAGLVAVDGRPSDDPELGCAGDGTRLCVAGLDWVCRDSVVLMLNKPPGYECSRTPTCHPSVLELLPPHLVRRGVQPVGRLDADTSGLLILTGDGALNHRLASPRHGVAKRYRVTLKHAIDTERLARLRDGVVLRDSSVAVSASDVVQTAPTEVLLTIHEGRYHQVKRMIAAVANRVEALQRVAVGGLELPDDLRCGEWRLLGAGELKKLEQAT